MPFTPPEEEEEKVVKVRINPSTSPFFFEKGGVFFLRSPQNILLEPFEKTRIVFNFRIFIPKEYELMCRNHPPFADNRSVYLRNSGIITNPIFLDLLNENENEYLLKQGEIIAQLYLSKKIEIEIS